MPNISRNCAWVRSASSTVASFMPSGGLIIIIRLYNPSASFKLDNSEIV